MASRSTITATLTNPTIGEIRAWLETIPTSADDKRPTISSYQDRPFDPREDKISVSYEVTS